LDFSDEKPLTWKTKRKGIDSEIVKFYLEGRAVCLSMLQRISFSHSKKTGKGYTLGEACILNLVEFVPLTGFTQRNRKKDFEVKYDPQTLSAILTVRFSFVSLMLTF
jgi:hypothetical protein